MNLHINVYSTCQEKIALNGLPEKLENADGIRVTHDPKDYADRQPFCRPNKKRLPLASGNSPDSQQGDIIELVGFANIILQVFCDPINQVSGAR